jgi:hypothetical protein
LKSEGRTIEADDLLAEMETAESAAKLCTHAILANKWDVIMKDFDVIFSHEKYNFVPISTMVVTTQRKGRELTELKKYSKLVVLAWPHAELATTAELVMNDKRVPQLSKGLTQTLWNYKDPRMAAIVLQRDSTDTESVTYAQPALIEDALLELFAGNWFYQLAKSVDDGPEQIAEFKEAVITIADEFDNKVLTSAFYELHPRLECVTKLYKGCRALVESCFGEFNQTSLDDVDFIAPFCKKKKDEPSLATSGLKSGPALVFVCRAPRHNHFVEARITYVEHRVICLLMVCLLLHFSCC